MAGRSTNTHSLNMVIACLTKLTIHFRQFLIAAGIDVPDVIKELEEIELVLPTGLNLKHEFVSESERELLGKTHVPIHDVAGRNCPVCGNEKIACMCDANKSTPLVDTGSADMSSQEFFP